MASFYLRRKFRDQCKRFIDKFKDKDLSSIGNQEILNEIDPSLWNFLFVLTGSEDDIAVMVKENFTWFKHYLAFHIQTSFPRHLGIVRLMYNICHLMFTATDGECKYPLHSLLGDAVKCHGGTKPLIEQLNHYGVVPS